MVEKEYLKIRRPVDFCLLCGEPLNKEVHHPSAISLSEKEEVIRRDFCGACWEKSADAEYFSFWLTKRLMAPTAKERRLAKSERNEALWRLFLALHGERESAESDLGPHLFLLAHLLMRYRVLEFEASGGDGVLRFRHGKTGEVFDVPDVPLGSEDFLAIKKSVEEKAVEFGGANEEGLE